MSGAVELRGVGKRFGATTVLHAVDLAVRSGEFLTLLGPSGCGKTTLLRLIGGFETPDGGSVWLEGRDVTAVPPYRRAVNTVFQNYALFPHLTVFQNVAFGLRMQKTPPAEIATRVAEALALVSLDGLDVRRPHQLSGGQRQRVALARALVCRPKVLLLDEPLAALDAKLRHAMQLELKALQRKVGLTFIFVTHDQQEALAMSDRIALLNAGRLEQIGPAREIYARPRTAFVADFIGRANLIEAEVIDCGEGRLRCVASDGLTLAAASDRAVERAARVTLAIRPERLEVAAEQDGRPNAFSAKVLDSVFKGSATEVLLVTPQGRRLHALSAASFDPGAEVWCSVPPTDVVALL